MRNLKSRLFLAAAFVIALFAVTANAGALSLASSNGSQETAAPVRLGDRDDTWLRIAAFTNAPVQRATIRVYDTHGKLLYERHRAKNTRGVFPSLVSELPRDFRVTVVWLVDKEDEDQANDSDRGEDEADVLAPVATLSADVRNFDRAHGIVFVNPVTTIVSRVLDRFPQLNLQQAQALVRRFLGLPRNYSRGAALREGKQFHSRYFSETSFLAQAQQFPSIGAFIKFLVDHAAARPLRVHSFGAQNSLGGVASFIARNLVSGALSWAGGQGAGWVAQSAA